MSASIRITSIAGMELFAATALEVVATAETRSAFSQENFMLAYASFSVAVALFSRRERKGFKFFSNSSP